MFRRRSETASSGLWVSKKCICQIFAIVFLGERRRSIFTQKNYQRLAQESFYRFSWVISPASVTYDEIQDQVIKPNYFLWIMMILWAILCCNNAFFMHYNIDVCRIVSRLPRWDIFRWKQNKTNLLS